MERLTEDYNDSYCLKKCPPNNDCFCDGGGCPIDNCREVIEALNKLGEYEKAEEQGLLVRLPCKVGDTVYVKLSACCKSKYAEAHVRDYTYFTSCGFCVVVTSTKFNKQSIPFSEFGKSIFLTREEVGGTQK